MVIPGGSGETFQNLFSPSFRNGEVLFEGASSGNQHASVLLETDGVLTVVANTNTTVPDGSGNFTGFDQPSFHHSGVLFLGGNSDGSLGLYGNVGGLITTIADGHTPIPNGQGNFRQIFLPNSDAGNLAFTGCGVGCEFGIATEFGIYADFGSGLFKVIDINDFLDGKELVRVITGNPGLSGDQIAFLANFKDGSKGIYVATIPEPDTALLLLMGLLGLARCRRGSVRDPAGEE